MEIPDRVALVTGAASGIGRATALRLAREGANVVAPDEIADAVVGLIRDEQAAGRALRLSVETGREYVP